METYECDEVEEVVYTEVLDEEEAYAIADGGCQDLER